jgi:hypothetical protein
MLSHVEMRIHHTQLLELLRCHLTSGHDESVKKVLCVRGFGSTELGKLEQPITSNFANDWENCDTNIEKLGT